VDGVVSKQYVSVYDGTFDASGHIETGNVVPAGATGMSFDEAKAFFAAIIQRRGHAAVKQATREHFGLG
jgi:hypothetical protein